jgi:hypothetical protein
MRQNQLAVGSSAMERNNLFTVQLPLLSEDDEMKNSNMKATLSKPTGYVPPYRSLAAHRKPFEDKTLMFSDCNSPSPEPLFCSADRDGMVATNAKVNNRFKGNPSGAFSPYSGASPVPSVVSSEYSVSP